MFENNKLQLLTTSSKENEEDMALAFSSLERFSELEPLPKNTEWYETNER
jgi:hypothetical protein